MVDPERILANALEDDYARLYDTDLVFDLSAELLDDTSFHGDDGEMENSPYSNASSSNVKLNGVSDLLKSEDFMGINEDCKITIRTNFTPPQTLCADSQIRLALSEQELNCIPPCYSLIETAILCGDNLDDPFNTFASSIRRHCIEVIMKDRYECMFSFDELLAMLAHVCACSIASLLPPGEVSCPAERYLSDQLRIPGLTLVKVNNLKRVSVARVKFLFDLVSFWDFMHYGETELMLLLFAFSKIYIDELSDIQLKLLICNAITNVLGGFSEKQRRMVYHEFSSIFEFVDESMEGLSTAMKMMSDAPVLNLCKLVCLRRTLVRLVERADLDPESSEVTDEEHFAAVVVLIGDFFKIFKKDRQKMYCVLCLLSETVDFGLLNAVCPEHLSKLIERLTEVRRAYVKEGSSNGAILERATEAIIRRIDIWRPRKVTTQI